MDELGKLIASIIIFIIVMAVFGSILMFPFAVADITGNKQWLWLFVVSVPLSISFIFYLQKFGDER